MTFGFIFRKISYSFFVLIYDTVLMENWILTGSYQTGKKFGL